MSRGLLKFATFILQICLLIVRSLSQRFHSESLMLNRGLITFTLLTAAMNAQAVQKGVWFECDIVSFQTRCLPTVARMLRQGGKESSCRGAKRLSSPHRLRHTFCLSS